MSLIDSKNSKCRICLNETEELISIFSSNLINNVCEKIEKYADIKISQDDIYPHTICYICIEELKHIETFIEKCKQADKKLRQQDKEFVTFKEEYEDDSIHDDWIDIKMEENDDLPIIKYENYLVKDFKIDNKSYKKQSKKKMFKKSKKKTVNGDEIEKFTSSCICDLCGLKTKSRSAMEIHCRVHSGEKPYECSVCLKRFKQKSTLKTHIKNRHDNNINSLEYITHEGDKKFCCETCGKSFKCRTSLKIHLRVHSEERPYKCNICNKGFTQLGSLSVHQRRHRGERPYSCNICQKTFVEMTHLKRHNSVHSDARPYICSICGKGLKSPFALKQHIKLHSNSKEHICDKCGMSFTIKGSLDSHVRVVHSERSGQCTVCNKICSNLSDHMLLHTGEKPHSCEICNKRFSRKRGLIIHSKTHTEGGKYECSVPGCGKTFYAQWVLECHLLKHSGSTPYICQLCKKGFVRLCHLTKHLKMNHPNDDMSTME